MEEEHKAEINDAKTTEMKENESTTDNIMNIEKYIILEVSNSGLVDQGDALGRQSEFLRSKVKQHCKRMFGEWMAGNTTVGRERSEYNKLKKNVDQLATAIKNYTENTNFLIKRIQNEAKRKALEENLQILQPPVKIARSVGIQVDTIAWVQIQPQNFDIKSTSSQSSSVPNSSVSTYSEPQPGTSEMDFVNSCQGLSHVHLQSQPCTSMNGGL